MHKIYRYATKTFQVTRTDVDSIRLELHGVEGFVTKLSNSEYVVSVNSGIQTRISQFSDGKKAMDACCEILLNTPNHTTEAATYNAGLTNIQELYDSLEDA